MIRYCSLLQMDSNYQGDLTDIFIGAGGGANHHVNPSRDHDHDDHHHQNQLESQVNINSEWQLLYPSDPMNCGDNFGDPFSTMRDPLFHHEGYDNNLPEVSASSIVITGQAHDRDHATTSTTNNNNNLLSHTTRAVNLHHDDQDEDQLKRPCNIFSRMLQISPSSTSKLAVSPCGSSSILVNSPGPVKSCANIVPTGNHVIISANTSNKGNCLVDNTGLQIFSPRNPAIKRRKSQAKKVICIPAPAAASSRQTGEVVPSDLWAWRKYGQKPIKGSPYPRGYYRCSSSKGCSARKQVERSRTDPNMLVITYTSEHNHPWPTQRNALAGSTRLQPLKNRSASKSYSLGSHHHQKTAPNDDQEQKDNHHSDNNASNTNKSVKEEIDDMEMQLEKDDQLGEYITEKLPYGSNLHSDQDFFAELGEIEADPLKLLFTQGFSGNEQKDSKALDPFSLFDWAGDDNANANITPFDGL